MPIQVVIVAVFFLGMGLVALVRPAFVVAFFGMKAEGADARNEIRAVYGGFGVAVGILLLGTMNRQDLASGVNLGVAIALLGMAAGRLVSFVLERPGRWPLVFFAVEIALALLLFSALPETVSGPWNF